MKNTPSPTPEILCIGQVLMDCIIKGWDTSALHERVQTADSVTLSPGGDAFNESVVLSRLGHKVKTICVLGHDHAGDLLTKLLADNQIDTSAIIRNENARTPVAPLLVSGDGNRKSINAVLNLENFLDIPSYIFKGVRLVSLASLFRTPLRDSDMIIKICQEAKAAGAILSVDTKLPLQNPTALSDIREALSCIDYLFPNETEAAFYTKKTKYTDMADVFLEYGVKNVIIKTGEKGCFAKNKEETIELPAFDVQAVDSTGAGDNFAAGFLSSVLHGKTFRESLLFASSCAAICVQSVGATSGIKSRKQVEEFQETAHSLFSFYSSDTE